MSQIMEPLTAQTGDFQYAIEQVPYTLVSQRSAGGRGEYKVGLYPFASRQEHFPNLASTVSSECVDHDNRHSDRSTTSRCLRLNEPGNYPLTV